MPTLIAFFCLMLLVSPAKALDATPSDEAEIRLMLHRFGTAIVSRDHAGFTGLALSDAITFASAVDSTIRSRMRARRPDAKGYEIGSWPAFVDFVATSPVAVEERFSNIAIQSDGTVASLWFDYVFLEGGIESNRGHESWGLLKTSEGWKIASVIWSISDPMSSGSTEGPRTDRPRPNSP